MRRWGKRLLAVVIVLTTFKVARCTLVSREHDELDRLRYVGARLDERSLPGLAPGPPFDGEWLIVEHSMTIAAATNLAFRAPEDAHARRKEIARWLEAMTAKSVRAFDTAQWREDALESLSGPHGHVGALGHLAWAMGASCVVGNGIHPSADEVSRALARRFDASPSALIETYPNETYVPDNVVAIAGLALLDRCRPQARHQRTIARFLERMRNERLDRATGVLVFAPGQPGRGSGAAWMAYFLTFVDEDLAREQFTALFREFGVELPFGAYAIREWRRGVDRPGDVDSGPLVFGLSPSGTGFALAGPAFMGNEQRLHAMVTTAEAVGTTVGGEHRRYLVAPLVGDAITLATRSATPWTRRFLDAQGAGRSSAR